MEKSVLLERGSKVQFLTLAFIFCVNGVFFLILGNNMKFLNIILGTMMIVSSILYLLYASSAFSSTSKYAAKIRITDESIEIKTGFWKPLMRLNWQDIRQIHLGKYKVSFDLIHGSETITYDTSAEQSIQLKQLLRASAEERQLEVIGH